jgi:hypothetical protein
MKKEKKNFRVHGQVNNIWKSLLIFSSRYLDNTPSEFESHGTRGDFFTASASSQAMVNSNLKGASAVRF